MLLALSSGEPCNYWKEEGNLSRDAEILSKWKLLFALAKWGEMLALRSALSNHREEILQVYLEKQDHIISKARTDN